MRIFELLDTVRRGSATRRVGSLVALGVLSALSASCEPSEPPHWATGGAPLLLGPAKWRRDDEVIEIKANGEVLVDGDHDWTIDPVGRVVDEDNAPVALLFADGTLVGTDDTALGHVGLHNAAPPFRGSAWLALASDGTVIRFDNDGDRSTDGVWQGCAGPLLRTCTLVTQLVALRSYSRQPASGVSVGIGIGF